MALVDYASEEDDDHPETLLVYQAKSQTNNASAKRKERPDEALPALPDSFRDLYASSVRSSTHDDPSLHEGRQRTKPHIEGNWPSHVYIEWHPDAAEVATLESVIAQFKRSASGDGKGEGARSSLSSDLGSDAPLHISLSRSLNLGADEREPFLQHLIKSIAYSKVRPFELTLRGLRWAPNFEGNRWFLVLQLAPPQSDELNSLLRACNETAGSFQQPLLYQSPNPASKRRFTANELAPTSQQGAGTQKEISIGKAAPYKVSDVGSSDSFHVSIAWTLAEPSPEMMITAAQTLADNVRPIRIPVKAVKFKTGNVVKSLPLAGQPAQINSLIGL